MLFRLLRWISGTALEWFYRDIEVTGLEHVPRAGPLLVAANHPNALVDALVIGCTVPRTLAITAKATLFEHPLAARTLRAAGVIPLRRAADERARGGPPDPARNTASFDAILDRLAEGGAVLLFPEGVSHSEPALVPLRSGLARIALRAVQERGIRELAILPVGLTFEAKAEPRTRVLVEIGEPLPGATFAAAGTRPEMVTAALDERLRRLTLNFDSHDVAQRIVSVARILARVDGPGRSLARPEGSLAAEVEVARRAEAVRRALANSPPEAAGRAESLVRRMDALADEAARRGIPLHELTVTTDTAAGAWFAVREGAILAAGSPVAWWGRLNHWLPLRAARALARREARLPDEPAMWTIGAGAAFVLVAYVLQAALVWAVAGPWWSLAYLATLPPTAGWDLRLQDRLRHARDRMRAYRRLRSDPVGRDALRAEAEAIRREAGALEQLVRQRLGPGPGSEPAAAPVTAPAAAPPTGETAR